jgi:hypothetical protein
MNLGASRQVSVPTSDKTTNNIYANVTIANNTKENIRADYETTQGYPILSEQNDFELRVLRFRIPMSSVPSFLFERGKYFIGYAFGQDEYGDPFRVGDPSYVPFNPEVIHKPTSGNTLRLGGYVRADFGIFGQEEVKFTPGATQRSDKTQLFDPGYRDAVYHIEDFLAMVNRALRAGWLRLKAAIRSNNGLGGAADPVMNQFYPYAQNNNANDGPYITLEDAKFVLNLPMYEDGDNFVHLFEPSGQANTNATNPGAPAPRMAGIKLLMSAPLYRFFNGFPGFNFGVGGIDGSNPDRTSSVPGTEPNALNYGILVYDPSGCQVKLCPSQVDENVTVDGNTDLNRTLQRYPQEQSSVFAFGRATRLVVTTTMALTKEIDLRNDVSGLNPRQFEVLTDFIIPQDSVISNREPVVFNDPGNERYYDLKGGGVLSRVDLRVLVEYLDGRLIPLLLAPGEELTMKLNWHRKPPNELKQITDPDRFTTR